MEQNLVLIGFAVVLVGIILIIIGSFLQARDGKTQVGVGGFIGPVPVGFATSREMLYVVIGLSVALFVISLLLGRFWVK